MYIEEGKIKENISVLKDQFNGMVDEIRRISNNLMPSVLEVFGITIALKNLCTSTSEHSGIQVTFASQGSLESVHTKLKTYIYRIAQEALTNIVKHSAASKVSLTLVKDEEHLTLRIEDNGKGFILEEAALQRGNGLYNMRERVTLLHGKFEIRSSLNKGTQINVLLPIF
jgi:signal transduction histidine kinase